MSRLVACANEGDVIFHPNTNAAATAALKLLDEVLHARVSDWAASSAEMETIRKLQ